MAFHDITLLVWKVTSAFQITTEAPCPQVSDYISSDIIEATTKDSQSARSLMSVLLGLLFTPEQLATSSATEKGKKGPALHRDKVQALKGGYSTQYTLNFKLTWQKHIVFNESRISLNQFLKNEYRNCVLLKETWNLAFTGVFQSYLLHYSSQIMSTPSMSKWMRKRWLATSRQYWHSQGRIGERKRLSKHNLNMPLKW